MIEGISSRAAKAVQKSWVDLDVVRVPGSVAVAGKGTRAVLQGRRALKLVWDEAESGKLDSDALLAQCKAQVATGGKSFARPTKDAPKMAPVAKPIEAVCEIPFLAHAAMEPMNCVA